jgi:hypothetical protein
MEVLETDGTLNALQEEFPKQYEQLVNRTMFKNMKSIEMKMRTTMSTLNADKYGIHFRNGRYNLITGQFEDRINIITQAVENPHLVSRFIPYDWVPLSMEDIPSLQVCNLN